jgi:hypothetical protein
MLDLPPHLRPIREKVFGPGPAIRLDGNAKARIWSFAHGWTAKHCQPGQHRGPITRAFMEILKTFVVGLPQQRHRALLSELRNNCLTRSLQPRHRLRGDPDIRAGRHPGRK